MFTSTKDFKWLTVKAMHHQSFSYLSLGIKLHQDLMA